MLSFWLNRNNLCSNFHTASYVSASAPGLVMGTVATPSAIMLSVTGSYIGGSSIGASKPSLYAVTPASSTWILGRCTGTSLQMVKLVVTVSMSGQAYVYASAAGYTASTCSTASLTDASVYSAWNGRSVVNVATCDSCSGYGVRSLVYTITGTAQVIVVGHCMLRYLLSITGAGYCPAGQFYTGISCAAVPAGRCCGCSIHFCDFFTSLINSCCLW